MPANAMLVIPVLEHFVLVLMENTLESESCLQKRKKHCGALAQLLQRTLIANSVGQQAYLTLLKVADMSVCDVINVFMSSVFLFSSTYQLVYLQSKLRCCTERSIDGRENDPLTWISVHFRKALMELYYIFYLKKFIFA